MTEASAHARIAVSGPLRRTFVYRVPPEIGPLEPGQRVLVPFGRSYQVGFYLGTAERPPNLELKQIRRVIDAQTLFATELFQLCSWMAEYYFANPADCLAAALPASLKTQPRLTLKWGAGQPSATPRWLDPFVRPHRAVPQEVIARIRRESGELLDHLLESEVVVETWSQPERRRAHRIIGYRTRAAGEWADYFRHRKMQPEPFDGIKSRRELLSLGWTDYAVRHAVADGLLESVREEGVTPVPGQVMPREEVMSLKLTEEQQAVLREIVSALGTDFKPMLLHGVTGSGKTLVYCHVLRHVLGQGQSALVLTPEIALSGTTLAYIRAFFPEQATVIHSAMTDRERQASWTGIREGKFRVVIGPRSAVLAPVRSPGIIIVDEEHDPSFKQDDPAPRFHGRDSAIMRAKLNRIPVLLGSATPSLESYRQAQTGRYRLLRLSRRPAGAALPEVRVLDMGKDRVSGDLPFFSYPLKQAVQTRLERGEQVILFLNRRGHSPLLKCAQCGYVTRCPHCRINLTFHRSGRKLSCHYCGYVRTDYDTCANCGGTQLLYLGTGTQKVEEAIPRLFDGARVARFDSDAVTRRGKAYQVLADFARNRYNLLLGTQMVTKGLDLPGVTLVGVLSADLSLDLPDFRAAEKTFAQLTQVAGRSGRADRPGEVLIQSYYPDSTVIKDAAAQDFAAFAEREMASRRELNYPPFTRLINMVISDVNEDRLTDSARRLRAGLEERLRKSDCRADLLGPAPCPLYYLRKRYRRQLMIKTSSIMPLLRLLHQWEDEQPRFGLPTSVRIAVDVDPIDMM